MPKYIAIHFVNFHPSEETEIICPIEIEIYLLISSAKFHHLYIDIERTVIFRYLLRGWSSTERVSGLEWG